MHVSKISAYFRVPNGMRSGNNRMGTQVTVLSIILLTDKFVNLKTAKGGDKSYNMKSLET